MNDSELIARLRSIAEMMDDEGIGRGDWCDGPAVREAADRIEALKKRTVSSVKTPEDFANQVVIGFASYLFPSGIHLELERAIADAIRAAQAEARVEAFEECARIANVAGCELVAGGDDDGADVAFTIESRIARANAPLAGAQPAATRPAGPTP